MWEGDEGRRPEYIDGERNKGDKTRDKSFRWIYVNYSFMFITLKISILVGLATCVVTMVTAIAVAYYRCYNMKERNEVDY